VCKAYPERADVSQAIICASKSALLTARSVPMCLEHSYGPRRLTLRRTGYLMQPRLSCAHECRVRLQGMTRSFPLSLPGMTALDCSATSVGSRKSGGKRLANDAKTSRKMLGCLQNSRKIAVANLRTENDALPHLALYTGLETGLHVSPTICKTPLEHQKVSCTHL
jgi:hypothetical protein